MNRLELIREIEKLELRKTHFETVLKDIQSYYFHNGSINFKLETKDFNKAYDGTSITFNSKLMIYYLENEIGALENQLSDKISLMK